jgi:hypothetical protein
VRPVKFASVEGVARALLYEGYLLYPDGKSSVKNAKRWTFGTLYPKRHAARIMERSDARAEVLARGDAVVAGVRAVFLASCECLARNGARRVEAIERRIDFGPTPVEELLMAQSVPFACSARTWVDGDARYATRALEGVLEVGAAHLAPGVVKLSARLENTTPPASEPHDDDAELVSFGAAHLLFASEGGSFVSLLEPPSDLATLTKACRNEGLWPVLVGEGGRGDGVLASPVIFYDYLRFTDKFSHRFFFEPDELERMP